MTLRENLNVLFNEIKTLDVPEYGSVNCNLIRCRCMHKGGLSDREFEEVLDYVVRYGLMRRTVFMLYLTRKGAAFLATRYRSDSDAMAVT